MPLAPTVSSLLCVLACSTTALYPSAARSGEHRTVRLEYELDCREARCPSRATFEALVSARLGYSPFADNARWLARVRISENRARLIGRAELHAADGKQAGARSVDAGLQDCEALAGSLALTLAVAIDPQTLVPAPPSSRPATEPPPSPPVAQPQATAAVPALPEQPPEPWHFRLLTGAQAAAGALPGWALGGFLQAETRRGSIAAALSGTYVLGGATRALNGLFHSSAIAGGASVCFDWQDLGLCLHGTAGAFQVSGSQYANPRRGVLPLATIGPRLNVDWIPRPGVVIRGFGGADVALFRDSVTVGDSFEAWRTPPISLALGLGAGWEPL